VRLTMTIRLSLVGLRQRPHWHSGLGELWPTCVLESLTTILFFASACGKHSTPSWAFTFGGTLGQPATRTASYIRTQLTSSSWT
jgi:hypothetical protein